MFLLWTQTSFLLWSVEHPLFPSPSLRQLFFTCSSGPITGHVHQSVEYLYSPQSLVYCQIVFTFSHESTALLPIPGPVPALTHLSLTCSCVSCPSESTCLWTLTWSHVSCPPCLTSPRKPQCAIPGNLIGLPLIYCLPCSPYLSDVTVSCLCPSYPTLVLNSNYDQPLKQASEKARATQTSFV